MARLPVRQAIGGLIQGPPIIVSFTDKYYIYYINWKRFTMSWSDVKHIFHIIFWGAIV